MSKSITSAQVKAINAKMSNGWALDLRHYVMWGEKKATRKIELAEGVYLKADLVYCDSFDRHQPAYGSAYNVPNGKSHVELSLSVWNVAPDGKTASSHGLGQWVRVGEDVDRRNFSAIQKLTAEYTDSDIMALYDERAHLSGIIYG